MGSLVDRAVFGALREGTDAAFVAELVETFAEEAPRLLEGLRRAQAAGDVAALRRHAHALKSNGHTFGAHAFAAAARELELGGPAAPQDMAALAAALEALLAELRELCDAA